MKTLRQNKGFMLVLTMTFLSVIFIGGSSFLSMTTSETKFSERQSDSTKAFFLAEAGIERGIYLVKSGNPPSSVTYNLTSQGGANNYLEKSNITIQIQDLGNNLYQIASTSQVGNSAKTINSTVQKNPPSKVFDYGYFINNWGWFYGNGITANGDVRSNGRFDFRDNPRVEGHIYAGKEIDDRGQGIRGKGGQKDHQHPYSEELEMPNLQDLSYYTALAKKEGGNIKIGGKTIIDKVFGDDPNETGNIVLTGTSSTPIEITGPVVVTGDVVIKGTIKGQGVIYTGRNVYIAGDITYKNAPSSPRPASDDPSTVDNWVRAHKDKDLVGFAARESVIMGDYTGRNGGPWYSNQWLFGMGNEDVGLDGIPDTRDSGENDGRFDPAYEDLDGDGIWDKDYNWQSVKTQTDIRNFSNLPKGVTRFSDIATNYINSVDGVFYTNHAFAGRTGYGVHFNGAIISKDEAIIYRNTLVINYDERINSRYTSGLNRLIDLKLPVSKKVEIVRWWE